MRRWTAIGLRSMLAVALCAPGTGFAHESSQDPQEELPRKTATPIEHVIVVIGENHTFDNLFGAYQPPHGQTISNLLSKGIIQEDGTPGPNFAVTAQQQASDLTVYSIAPEQTGPYDILPQPNTTYATGRPLFVPDSRFPANLPNGPFQITRYVDYDAYIGDPIHRFFQMWQQYDKGKLDLFPWVGITVGTGPQNGSTPPFILPAPAPQGGEAMGFFNVQMGDAPHFASLARDFAISDNYHQPIMGGTGANFFAVATGDVAFYSTAGTPSAPPDNQIENLDPQGGTNNFYKQDGYKGGSYVQCADRTRPGVTAIRAYLESLPYRAFRNGNCAPGHYYLVNNYNPGFTPTGDLVPLGQFRFVVPPQTVPTIAEALSAKGVSWKWYSGGRNGGHPTAEYCKICDPFTHSTAVMTSGLKDNLQDVTDFYADVAAGTLPAVSFVRPPESKAGHPANATMPDFENFVVDLIGRVQSNQTIWAKAAILITTDEGGGYYDSGYIQPIDFFGDGTRIPLIAVSPFAKKGHVDHTYYDHVSILKFIERNWGLKPLSDRSRDNLPNPVLDDDHPYVPANRPAIGDLMPLFDFGHLDQEAMGGRPASAVRDAESEGR